MKKCIGIFFMAISCIAVSQNRQSGTVHVYQGPTVVAEKTDTTKKVDTTAQKKIYPADSVDNRVFTIVQQMPAFRGDVNKYISANIKYPEYERTKSIQGTVYVNFIVEKDGSISNVKVLKGVTNGPGLDKESVRVVSGMPKWSCGLQNGHPVRVSYSIPIRYVLQ